MSKASKIKEILQVSTKEIDLPLSDEINLKLNTAAGICESLQMDRANVSRILNELAEQGSALKINGKPVLFLDAAEVKEKLGQPLREYKFRNKKEFNDYCLSFRHGYNDIADCENKENISDETDNASKGHLGQVDGFEQIIGSGYTLKTQIGLAKAAITYPPKGVNTLLTGSSGVGKSTFAESMYRYGRSVGVFKEEDQFIVFNCADYAENPQLLLTQLFGYVKGAFTGANEEKKGLIDSANNGVLFLDEVHRLPPEGQEMLFLLIDKGVYRRLGEVENTRKVNAIIIGATTENIESSLLRTFRRRMPINIHLPDLKEYTEQERAAMVHHFFYGESFKTNIVINVDKQVLKACMYYDCPLNIGGLKSDIQLICAKAYYSCISNHSDTMEVHWAHLSDSMKKGLLNAQKRNYNYTDVVTDNDFTFDYKDVDKKDIILEPVDKIEFENLYYGQIIDNWEKYASKGLNPEDIRKHIESDLEEYFNAFHEKVQTSQLPEYNDFLTKIVDDSIVSAAVTALNSVRGIYGEASSRILCALSLHINNLIGRVNREEAFVTKDSFEVIENLYPIDYHASEKIIKVLEDLLKIKIPVCEKIFVTLLLHAMGEINIKNNIGMLLICHGNGVASGIAEVVNSLLEVECLHAIDMPLDRSVKDTLNSAIEKVREINQNRGVLILTDMGSLSGFGVLISEETGIETEVIDQVTTLVALEATRKSYVTQSNLKEFTKEIIEFRRNQLCDDYNGNNPPSAVMEEDDLVIALDKLLVFLNPRKIYKCLNALINKIYDEFDITPDRIFTVKFIIHCAHMVERQISSNPMPGLNLDYYKVGRKDSYMKMKELFRAVEEEFLVRIDENEYIYIFEIFDAYYNKEI